jgi:hypothetical protein
MDKNETKVSVDEAKAMEKFAEFKAIMGEPIAVARDFVWCICGTKHPVRKTATGNFRINCPELGYSFLSKTFKSLMIKLTTAVFQVIDNLSEEQKQRATEIMISRRVLDKMEGKRDNAANLARARAFAKELYNKSYLKDNGKGVVINFVDGHIEINFSGDKIEENCPT